MPGKTRLLRSLSLPKFPTVSKGKISSGLDCIFEVTPSSSPEANSGDNNDKKKNEKQQNKKEKRKVSIENSSKNSVISTTTNQSVGLVGVQKHGILWKKSCKRDRNIKWSKRFFILKDSFLLYYEDCEIKNFETKRKFNNHPKGVIPLDGCSIDHDQESGNRFSITILHDSFQSPVILATNDIKEQTDWIACLKDATKITSKSHKLGDVMIQELEIQGLRMHKERQTYVDRLQTEANALREEMDKSEMLEQIKNELELEKMKLEQTASELKNELNELKGELQQTIDNKRLLENEKQNLIQKTASLKTDLEELENEKLKIQKEFSLKELEKEKLTMENKDLAKVSKILQKELKRIEAKTEQMTEEKFAIELKLEENFQKTLLLEGEKQYYSSHAKDLMASLNNLSIQKEMTEAELKDEVIARLDAERHLRSALRALEHMELALKLNSPHITDYLKEEIMPDVKKLKHFFEECAEEAKLDANRPMIMRNAIYARKSMMKKCKDKVRNSFRRRTSPVSATTFQKGDNTLYIPITENCCHNGVDRWYSRDSFI